MTRQFREGQEVEVNGEHVDMPRWEKAKIVSIDHHGQGYVQVQFSDGTRGVFDAEHIRAIEREPKIIGYAKTGFGP